MQVRLKVLLISYFIAIINTIILFLFFCFYHNKNEDLLCEAFRAIEDMDPYYFKDYVDFLAPLPASFSLVELRPEYVGRIPNQKFRVHVACDMCMEVFWHCLRAPRPHREVRTPYSKQQLHQHSHLKERRAYPTITHPAGWVILTGGLLVSHMVRLLS